MQLKGEATVHLYKAQGAVDPSGTLCSTDIARALATTCQKRLLEELGPGIFELPLF